MGADTNETTIAALDPLTLQILGELLVNAVCDHDVITEFFDLPRTSWPPYFCRYNHKFYEFPEEVDIPIDSSLGSLTTEVRMSEFERTLILNLQITAEIQLYRVANRSSVSIKSIKAKYFERGQLSHFRQWSVMIGNLLDLKIEGYSLRGTTECKNL